MASQTNSPINRPPNRPSKAWKVRQMIKHKQQLRKLAGVKAKT